jgi:hypothetical protein
MELLLQLSSVRQKDSIRRNEATFQTQLRDPAARSARGLQVIFAPLKTEGAGKTGCALHPRSRVRFAQNKLHTSIQGSGEHPAFPAQWLYGL